MKESFGEVGDLVTASDLVLLADTGFIALSYGFIDQAKEIFAGICAARPDQEGGVIGSALVCIAQGDCETAVSMLKSIPASDAVYTFLGIAFAKQGDLKRARECLSMVAKKDGSSLDADSPFAALAEGVLGAIGSAT